MKYVNIYYTERTIYRKNPQNKFKSLKMINKLNE